MAALVSFFCAILSGLGVGGGNLFMVYLREGIKLDQKEAQGVNLVFFVSATFVCLIIHLVKRRIHKKIMIYAIPLVIIGGLLGGALATSMNNGILSKLFGLFLIATGIFTLYRARRN